MQRELTVNDVNRLLSEGFNLKQIATMEGILVGALMKRMRNRGARWDKLTERFMEADSPVNHHIVDGKPLPSKAVQAMQMLRSVSVRPADVAHRLGFHSQNELADYMRKAGLVWNSDVHNYCLPGKYERRTGLSNAEVTRADDLITTLRQVLEVGTQSTAPRPSADAMPEPLPSDRIPRYRNSSKRASMSTHLAENIQDVLKHISRETKIPRCEILEIALIDFCRNYGFETIINTVLD